MTKVIGVRFRTAGKIYFFAPGDLKIKKGILVACISRDGQAIIPRGSDKIMTGDSVVIITQQKGLNDIEDILL